MQRRLGKKVYSTVRTGPFSHNFLLFAITKSHHLKIPVLIFIHISFKPDICFTVFSPFLAQYLSCMTHFRVGPHFILLNVVIRAVCEGWLSAPNRPSHIQMNFRHVRNFSQPTQDLAQLEQIPQPSVLYVSQRLRQETNRASEHAIATQHWSLVS